MELLTHDSIGLEAYLTLAVDEFLRFESSNQLSNRRALKASRIGDVELPQGSLLTLCIGAANRDPAQFSQPDRLDLTRQNNRHLAFGFGIHQCAGLSLARLEGWKAGWPWAVFCNALQATGSRARRSGVAARAFGGLCRLRFLSAERC